MTKNVKKNSNDKKIQKMYIDSSKLIFIGISIFILLVIAFLLVEYFI